MMGVPSIGPNGRRRPYLFIAWPHSLLSTRRLHSEQFEFKNLEHMLHFWAYELY